jgi:hypothetical protein
VRVRRAVRTREVLHKRIVRTSHPKWKAVQVVDVLPWVVIVKAFLAAHCLTRSRNGARGSKRPEEVDGGECGDGTPRRYGCRLFVG